MHKANEHLLSNQKDLKNESERLAAAIFTHVPKAMQAIRHEMRSTVQGLTIPQFRILAHLELGPTNHCDLANWIGVSLPAISRMVNILEDRNLVIRDRQRKDRRYVHLTLSEEGSVFFRKCKSQGQRSLSKRFSNNMSVENKRYIIEALRILGSALAQPEEENEKTRGSSRNLEQPVGMRSRAKRS